MFNLENLTQSRQEAAELLRACLFGELIVREALIKWPDSRYDPTLACARHALIHFEADEDMWLKDKDYRDQQIEWIEQLINILSKGEALPANIIDSYEEFYVLPVPLNLRLFRFFTRLAYPLVAFITRIAHSIKH
ncbi:MAG: hypothetical protein AB7V50_09670 [Vampirovibrionia bacterium]